jgi:subtilisin family serine protease
MPKGLLALKRSFAATTKDMHRLASTPGPWVTLMTDLARYSLAPHYFVALALVMSATPAFAQAGGQAGGQAEPPLARSLQFDLGRIDALAPTQAARIVDPLRGQIVTALIKGPVSGNALRAMGLVVSTQTGGYTTVRMPLSAAPQVARLAGVEAIRLAAPLHTDNDLSIPDTRANQKRTQVPPYQGFNGNGVIVGEVDTGIMYQHQDFRNPDGSTRLLAIWDQTGSGSPPLEGYGNECTQAQINAGTCGEVDFEGHGTHTTGTAAGDGSATGNAVPAGKYSGMANKASIIMVKTDFFDASIIDGVSYVFRKATELNMPAVVNLSLGTNLGPHDGKSDLELALQSLVGPGRLIVASAGNDQTDKLHGVLTAKSALDSLSFVAQAYTGSAGPGNDFFVIDGWYKGSDNFNLTVVSPSNTVYGPFTKGTTNSPGVNTTDGTFYYENGTSGTNDGDVEVFLQVSDNGGTLPRAGGWRIRMTPVSVAGASLGQIHFWSYSNLSPTYLPVTFATKFSSDITVGSPATADSILGVGAHTTKAQWTSSAPGQPGPFQYSPAESLTKLCSFSSWGPRRDGVMKPDLTAPGSAIASSLDTVWVSGGAGAGWDPRFAVDDGKHAVLQGTSMAAPHVTGAIAMMLQQNPNLNPTLARQLLTANTRRDAQVTNAGAVPNKKFGWGKLDLTNVVPNVDTIAPTITVTHPNGGEVFGIGAQDTIRWTASDNIGVTAVDLDYSPDNGLNWNPIAAGLANTGSYLWSVPNDPSTQALVRATAHDSQNQTTDQSNAVFNIQATTGVPGTPLAFAVHHPTPSPFTGSTSIAFDLPPTAGGALTWRTTARIYNLAGRLVRTALAADLAPGPHVAVWDGKDEHGRTQPSGVYFISIATTRQSGQVRAVYLR